VRPTVRRVLPLVWLAAFTACGQGGSTGGSTGRSVFDTLGVPVTHVGQAELARAPVWTLGEPEVLPAFAGAARLASSTYLESVLPLADGRRAVVTIEEGGVIAIHRVSAAGILDGVSTIGAQDSSMRSRGDASTALVGDTVVLLSVWGSSGSRALLPVSPAGPGTFMEWPAGMRSLVGALADGSLLAFGDADSRGAVAGWRLQPLIRLPAASWHEPPAGLQGDTVAVLGLARDDDGRALVFAHNPLFPIAVIRELLWVAPTSAPEVVGLSGDGEPVRRFTWLTPDRKVTPEALQQWRAQNISGLPAGDPPEHLAVARANIERRTAAAEYPSVTRILGTPDGHVYIERYPLPSDSGDQPRWLVFGPDGGFVARLRSPVDATVVAVDQDHLLARPDRGEDRPLLRYPVLRGGDDGHQ